MHYTQQDFLDEVVAPYFMGSIKKDHFSVIYDLDGKVFVCTNQFARMLGYESWKYLKGKSIADFSIQMPQCDQDFYKNLETIRQKVVTNSLNIQYINFLYNTLGIVSQMVYHFPIFMPSGEIVASRVIANNFNIVDAGIGKFMNFVKLNREKLLNLSGRRRYSKHTNIELTDREYSIAFLVAANLHLDEIAIFLDMSINKVLWILEHSVCKKFGLNVPDLELLRQLIINSELINCLPRKFMKPRSIIVNSVDKANIGVIAKF